MEYTEHGIYIETEQLASYGENAARAFRAAGFSSGKAAAKSIQEDLKQLKKAHTALAAKAETGPVNQTEEWLLDNWYLAVREGQEAFQAFHYAKRLCCAGGTLRISHLGTTLLRAGEGGIDEERCRLFLEGYQRVSPLSRGELGLFIPALIAEAVHALAQLYRSGEYNGAYAGRLFSTLRLLATLDFSPLLEQADLVEQTLSADPAGVYPHMADATRDAYRREVAKLAERHKMDEYRVAKRVLKLSEGSQDPDARHVGYFLYKQPLGHSPSPFKGTAYMSVFLITTLLLTLLLGFHVRSILGTLLLLLPVSEVVKNLIDYLLTKFVTPRHIPRMELAGGIPDDAVTICVVSTLLTDEAAGKDAAKNLEEFYLSNRDCGKNLLFGILADLKEGNTPTLPEDESCIFAAKAAIDELNKKYGGGFYLFYRERTYNERDERYCGYERKRGALLSLAKLMQGKESGLIPLAGEVSRLWGAKYILTLDADTRLCPGTARELVGAMEHPLNRPVFDPDTGVVVSGYGLIHPRIATDLTAATATDFARIFAGQGGTDPYSGSCGELYMDLFDSGGFAGKGIISAQMLTACSEQFPEGRILSHDALEGACLHGGYLWDTELTDGFPASPISYMKRMERWTRGDWQNAPWLFGRGKHLTRIDRFRLFDSLRRSLVAPATFLCLLCGFFLPAAGPIIAAWAAFIALLSRFLLTIAEDAVRPDQERKVRYHSTIFHGVKGALTVTVSRLILLPWEAWVTASAIFKALWRMCVSHKNLLSWETFSQSGGSKKGFTAYLRAMAPSMITGIALLILPCAIIGKAVGVIWLVSPLFALSISRPKERRGSLSAADRGYLTARAGEIWQYFVDFCTEADHYLPPDNVQEQPPRGAAHRTSPTNIGLAMTSALTAADLGLDRSISCEEFIDRILTTLEEMPKWKGHLYNWYDTRTLKVLNPEYVSTVDSGNLAAALITVEQGMLEYGRPDLAKRARALFDAMDFAPLYDPRRNLFHIGMDLKAGKLSEGWYDLLSSEARLTAYVAIAKGDVPRKHWRRLSRALVSKDRYRGMASWSGSMFEYLMPELFLPLHRDSLLYETAKFCLYVQRTRPPRGVPWGISESAFFSLDTALNYRYKAHGCGALALKRGMDEELVISPYSTFLALTVTPTAAVRNLRRLEKLGAMGPYGFYEALDFTPARSRADSGETVRCFMAHHLGMSMTAIGNCLRGNANVRRFMAEPAMAAHRCLLEEKVPIGGRVLRNRSMEPPMKPPRVLPNRWEAGDSRIDYTLPAACILSNGSYTIIADETGRIDTTSQDVTVYNRENSPLTLRVGDTLYPLFPQPGTDWDYAWNFTSQTASFTCDTPLFTARTTLAVSAGDRGEVRTLELKAKQNISNGVLLYPLEPVLAFTRDYAAHPAYCRLGLRGELVGSTLVIARAPRAKLPALYLAVSCSLPMAIAEPLGDFSDPSLTLTVPISVEKDGVFDLRFTLCTAVTERAAIEGSRKLLAAGREDLAALPESVAVLLHMTGEDVALSMELLRRVRQPHSVGPVPGKRSLLWKYGISGDFPIIAAHMEHRDQQEEAVALIRRHALLNLCGFSADLVLLCAGSGDYLHPTIRQLEGEIAKLGLESSLGGRGGVHLLSDSEETLATVLPFAVESIALFTTFEPKQRKFTPTHATYRSLFRNETKSLPTFHWNEDSFTFTVHDSLPPRVWANVLTNGNLSWLATDAGVGHLWYQNAAMYRITPWDNDPYAVHGRETLEYLPEKGAPISLFAANDGRECRVTYGFGWAKWEKAVEGGTITTTAFIPPHTDARVFLIHTDLTSARFRWKADMVLGENERDAACVQTYRDGSCLCAKNPASLLPETTFRAVSDPPFTEAVCDGSLMGQFTVSETSVLVCGCGEGDTLMALAQTEAAFLALDETRKHWNVLAKRLTVDTSDDTADRSMNGWAVYQSIACRILGRSSLYQSGGAFGFRDQLQDAVNMLLIDPTILREQIPLCCARQYPEGDVQHWWHMPEGRGVRTRCSDDLLWLPWALCEYVEKTGDRSICDETTPYLDSPPLSEAEHDRYELALPGTETDTVVRHACRALDCVIARGEGEHGLLLMLGGDWNDGFGAVGLEGRGESVWLTWFFAHTASRFADLLDALELPDGEKYRRYAQRYGSAANAAWDGAWYVRGYYDDGSPLGSRNSDHCQMDSIAQSWAVLSGYGDETRRGAALDSALDRLFDKEHQIVRLFDPPIPPGELKSGYISGYGPGFRENGGQYTHAAVWLAQALLREGRTEDGWAVLKALWPDDRDIREFEGEPFVIPADVYSNPCNLGKCGWSWYTGSAGWYFRVFSEDLLGLKLKDGALTIAPNLPKAIPGYSARFRCEDGKELAIQVKGDTITVDGAPYIPDTPISIVQKDFINN